MKIKKGKSLEPEVIPKGEFVRVTIKEEGKRQRSFWAIKDVGTPVGNIYIPVDKEGAPSIRYKKDVAIETKYLIARGFIVKEQIAHLDRTYGILKLGRLEPPTAEELGKPPAVEKAIRLTVRAKTYRGEAGFTVKGEDTDIFFSKESQAREYVRRIKAGEKPDKVLSDIWHIKQVRSGYTIAELMRIHASRSPFSQASDERQSHQVTISADNVKARAWAKDQGIADIQGIDTPVISRRTQRITPRVGRLK